MTIDVVCPFCKQQLKIEESFIGDHIICIRAVVYYRYEIELGVIGDIVAVLELQYLALRHLGLFLKIVLHHDDLIIVLVAAVVLYVALIIVAVCDTAALGGTDVLGGGSEGVIQLSLSRDKIGL